jgi:leukotriene A-4 hydrolase/aminopeptidase
MKRFALILSMTVLFAACDSSRSNDAANNDQNDNAMAIKLEDPHSYAKPNEAVVKHLSWKAKVDFDQKVIVAEAEYAIENLTKTKEIIFDTKDLEIEGVFVDGKRAGFKLAAPDSILGSALRIPIEPNSKQVTISYKTSPSAEALQFLDPEQTTGKKSPFLFTQSQAIMARSWIPSQDSPGIRFTYDAEVTVPEGMMAVMSAENPTEKNDSGLYTFKMDQAVPSYLVALAVGDLVYKEIGAETGVYAEPEVIDAAVYEFADMQDMVDTAEALYGPYRWGKYDVIVLPPSFPFGGMENPRLTFATPTIIAGDRSLTALIAHELAHSWSGNLVTNVNWEDIWLNEGFTVYFENRIMEEIYGKDYANMLAILSYQDLVEEVEDFMANGRAADTRLKVDLKGRNPDDGLSSVPYDKGFYFLKLIEESVGRERFDAFLNQYFDEFAFQVMNTKTFLAYLDKNLLSENPEWKEKVNVEEWVYGEGIPSSIPVPESNKFKAVDTELNQWSNGKNPSELKVENWSTPQWLHFIRSLDDELEMEAIKSLDQAFNFTNSGNREIQAAWFTKVIPNNYDKADQEAENFLILVGRRKFLTPIYKAYLKSDFGRDRALEIYEKARPNYHSVSRETIDGVLKYES